MTLQTEGGLSAHKPPAHGAAGIDKRWRFRFVSRTVILCRAKKPPAWPGLLKIRLPNLHQFFVHLPRPSQEIVAPLVGTITLAAWTRLMNRAVLVPA
jgi:hypothetical protein